MENIKTNFAALLKRAVDYAETRVNLLKLQVVEKIAQAISSLIYGLFVILISSIIFFSLNIALALWIGNLLGKTYMGFFIVAGFYTVFFVIIFLFRNTFFKKGVSSFIIKKILK